MSVVNKKHCKYVLLMLPLAVFPDFDLYFDHRGLLHNLFIPLSIVGVYSMGWFEKYERVILIGLFYISSHIFLDIFNGGVSILYPVYDKLFFVNFDMFISNVKEITWVFDWGFKKRFVDWTVEIDKVSIFGSVNFGIFVMMGIMYYIKQKQKGYTEYVFRGRNEEDKKQ